MHGCANELVSLRVNRRGDFIVGVFWPGWKRPSKSKQSSRNFERPATKPRKWRWGTTPGGGGSSFLVKYLIDRSCQLFLSRLFQCSLPFCFVYLGYQVVTGSPSLCTSLFCVCYLSYQGLTGSPSLYSLLFCFGYLGYQVITGSPTLCTSFFCVCYLSYQGLTGSPSLCSLPCCFG